MRKEKKALGFLEPDEEEITDEAFGRLYRKGFKSPPQSCNTNEIIEDGRS